LFGFRFFFFGTRNGKGGVSVLASTDFDFYAFVVFPSRKVAYLTKTEMLTKDGNVKQTIDFKSADFTYKGRIYTNGTQRSPEWGKYFEQYNEFKP
jgi:hypothetical protein